MVEITERDIELLKWINGFGFVMAGQVARWMGVDEKVAGRRLRKLESIGLISRERVFHRGGSVVRVTKEGVKTSGDELNPMKNLRLGTFEHDKIIVDLSLDLVSQNVSSHFLSERRIRHERGQKGVGQKGHISDGILTTSDKKKIAVELELSRKQRWRLDKIISEFQADMSLDEVWYFCSDNVIDLVREVVGGDQMFSIFRWPNEESTPA